MSSEDYQALFEQQRITFQALRTQPVSKPIALLSQLETWVINHVSDIQKALMTDLGKGTDETNVSEILPTLGEVRHARKHLKSWSAPKSVPGSWSFLGTKAVVVHEPKGICLIISPWNYPWLLALGPLISAIAAGNSIILKPSEYAKATSQLISDMVGELFDPSMCTVCLGDHTVSESLLELPFNHVFFTGSPRVGRLVMQAASVHLSSVTLELGGKSPTVVDASADLKVAAKRIAWGKWINAGQTCVAPDYLLVDRQVSETFLEHLKGEIEVLYNDDSGMTKIVNEAHFTRLQNLLDQSVEAGAQVVLKGAQDPRKRSMGPVVITELQDTMDLMQEEIFGPILPVVAYDHLDHAIDMINSKPNPLALYVFSKDKKTMKRIVAETSSGGVVFNDCVLQFAHPNLPFGGVNNSGIGRSHGQSGFEAFSNQKSILKQSIKWSLSQMVYPPYDKFKKAVINILIKYI